MRRVLGDASRVVTENLPEGWRKGALAATASLPMLLGPALAGGSSAEARSAPMELTNEQLDQVTAGQVMFDVGAGPSGYAIQLGLNAMDFVTPGNHWQNLQVRTFADGHPDVVILQPDHYDYRLDAIRINPNQPGTVIDLSNVKIQEVIHTFNR